MVVAVFVFMVVFVVVLVVIMLVVSGHAVVFYGDGRGVVVVLVVECWR